MATKTTVAVSDKDRGFARLMGELGEMGSVVVGVQGKEALETHPDASIPVGQLAQMHELGLGVPQRSFLAVWFEENSSRLRDETQTALVGVLAGRESRKSALARLGYQWTQEVRENMDANRVTGPALAPSTVRKKGHAIKLEGLTFTLRNSVTYKVFLPQKRSIRDTKQRMAARGQSGE